MNSFDRNFTHTADYRTFYQCLTCSYRYPYHNYQCNRCGSRNVKEIRQYIEPQVKTMGEMPRIAIAPEEKPKINKLKLLLK